MIVVGVDPHKTTHTAVAVNAQLGEPRGELTVSARQAGHEQLLSWARALDSERVFALEDCRHVSGALERFLIGRGERVARVPPKLMGEARRRARSFGKSDSIDALAVARAALREPDLPQAQPAGEAREIALLLDHREDLGASFLARKQAEDKSRREALRCLKRHLARLVFKILHALAAGHRDGERLLVVKEGEQSTQHRSATALVTAT